VLPRRVRADWVTAVASMAAAFTVAASEFGIGAGLATGLAIGGLGYGYGYGYPAYAYDDGYYGDDCWIQRRIVYAMDAAQVCG
jgi:hypothetical protein